MVEQLTATQKALLVAAAVLTAAAAIGQAASTGEVARFVLSGLALAALAGVVGQAIEQVGERLGPSATGLLQSTLGNLPELFVALFALHDGLIELVQASLVGSVLGNVLLVLGCAFVAGGLRHGPQRFTPDEPRMTATLLVLIVAALLVPTLVHSLDTPAASHAVGLSNATAVVLLLVYGCSVVYSLRTWGPPAPPAGPAVSTPVATPVGDGGAGPQGLEPVGDPPMLWSMPLAVVILVLASGAAAFVARWFVEALTPAIHTLGLSEAFTGLVIVAIASNAVEHTVGIRFALRAKPEFAISTTLNSPLQVALLLIPVLVLASNAVGAHPLTLVFPPLLITALAISTVVVALVVYDGEYNWLEGTALVGLYCMIAAAFWWG
jgi:Ca2+:H+ antiporter